MTGLLPFFGVCIWFYVWWKTTKAAWADAGVTGDNMKALASTVILAPIFATIAMVVCIFILSSILGIPWS
jgi:hypothetical protein